MESEYCDCGNPEWMNLDDGTCHVCGLPIDTTLRMYAYQPQGHGEDSFFVVAASEYEAMGAVADHIEKKTRELGYSPAPSWLGDYTLTIADRGAVVANNND